MKVTIKLPDKDSFTVKETAHVLGVHCQPLGDSSYMVCEAIGFHRS